MLQGRLCSLGGNGKRQRREEEEASCEAHHFGRWSVLQHPVLKSSGGRQGFAREKRQHLRDLLDRLVVPGSFGPGVAS